MDAIRDQFGIAERTKSPIILDLDGDGVQTTGVKAGAYFDHAGDGFAEQTGWVGGGDGLLVYDRNGNGLIDDGAELFGNNTLLADGTRAANGFEALKELDDNLDGRVDAQDAAFVSLRVWKDVDGNGYISDGELLTLEEVGVQSIGTGYTSSTLVDANGNALKQTGSYTTTDGQNRAATDVWFRTDSMHTIAGEWVEVPDDIAALPDLRGYGQVYNLHQAMARDTSGHLKSLVEQFAAESDPVVLNALTTQIIYAWAGVEDKDPLSRAARIIYGNPIGDARKLYALEAFLGEGYEGTWCWAVKDPNPHGPAAAKLLRAFDEFAASITAQLLAQTQLRDFYAAISYTWDEATQTIKGDLSGTIPLIADKLAADREQGQVELAAFVTNLTHTHNLSAFDTQVFQQEMETFGEDVAAVVALAFRGMVATQGSDRLIGSDDDDIIAGWGGNDIIYGGAGNDTLLGGDGDDKLYGEAGHDVLDGGAGNDYLAGGPGNDTYLFGKGDGQDTIFDEDDTAGNMDTIRFGEGIAPDEIMLSRSGYDLVISINGTDDQLIIQNWGAGEACHIERIEFTPPPDSEEDGVVWDAEQIRALIPLLVGTEGDDALFAWEGDAGPLQGMGGNDTLYGSSSDNMLDGGMGDDCLYGGGGNDTLLGGDGDDWLDGGAGADIMLGGAGNDTYVVDNPDDGVTELEAEGIDTVRASIGWTLGDHVENLTLTGNAAINGTGNELDNVITGNNAANILQGLGGDDTLVGGVGNDVLDGGSGADLMIGGRGNDTYYVDNPGDVVVEQAGEGIDTVYSTISWTLPDHVEHLTLTGRGALSGRGNHLDNTIIGNGASNRLYGGDGSDLLDGGGAADFMYGGTGNDTYFVDNTGDKVIEYENEGIDTVISSVHYSLSDHVENLTLTGTANLHGRGNGLDNVIIGNGGDNTLRGMAGNDILSGGAGNDTFIFKPNFGHDTITDFSAGAGSDDVLEFDAQLFAGFAGVMESAQQMGNDVAIHYDDDNSLTLLNVDLNHLHADDFRFVA